MERYIYLVQLFDANETLFPPQSNILETEVATAERVATLVFERNLARVDEPKDVSAWLRGTLYKPEYKYYVP